MQRNWLFGVVFISDSVSVATKILPKHVTKKLFENTLEFSSSYFVLTILFIIIFLALLNKAMLLTLKRYCDVLPVLAPKKFAGFFVITRNLLRWYYVMEIFFHFSWLSYVTFYFNFAATLSTKLPTEYTRKFEICLILLFITSTLYI